MSRNHASRVMTASTNMKRRTPARFFGWWNAMFQFTVDVAASAENALCPKYFDEETDGLRQSWEFERAWCNPPYGRHTPAWFDKARNEVVWNEAFASILVPVRVGSKWWRKYVRQLSDDVAGRLRRVDASATGLDLHWYVYDRMTVGVYVHDQRLPFDGLEDDAPFDSAVIIMAGRRFRPPRGHRERCARFPEFPNLIERWPT